MLVLFGGLIIKKEHFIAMYIEKGVITVVYGHSQCPLFYNVSMATLTESEVTGAFEYVERSFR